MIGRAGPILLLGATLVLPLRAGPAQGAPGGDYLSTVQPGQAEGRAVLERCREAGLPGDYFYEFVLRILPRRGPERDLSGRLWAGRDADGLVWRIEIDLAGGGERRWLIQGGPRPAAWRSDQGRPAVPAGSFEPLADGVYFTPFDLQFPPTYLYWPDETLEGMGRVLGRPAYVFLIRPPAGYTALHPEVAAVRARLDAEYDVPVQTELLGPDGSVRTTLSLVDLKRVAGQWIVKEVDARDEATRNKSRLDVTGVAANLDFSPELFAPARLADRVEPPPPDQVSELGP